ncbi:unnamed protein product [Phaedon cochleariae]|uniref:E3 SUMO-protein ligase NSE2 n=1 Tax=Phaedon cochleariae TaxID=80249 RepID=A0A9P0DX08_PHACE|nr:unnamed protein product [Phaedon cochleariae]
MALYERLEENLDKCIRSLDIWKQLINENCDDEQEKRMEMEKLTNCVKSYCDIDKQIKSTENALRKLDEKMNDPDSKGSEDIDHLFQEYLQDDPTASTNNYKESPLWKKVIGGHSDVVEVRQKKSKIDDTQFEELGDSLLCSNVFAPPIDPISKTVIQHPYKNKRCKHVYEYGTISNYIKQMKNKAKCPYIGCNNNNLRLTDLVEDGNLQVQISQYLETQQEEDDDSEDED